MATCSSFNGQPTALAKQGESMLRRLGLWDALQHAGEIGRTAALGHTHLDRLERSRVLAIDIGSSNQLQAERELGLARRHATAARRSIATLTATPEWKKLAKTADELHGSADLVASLKEARDRWSTIVLNSKIPAADASEVMGIWDGVSEHLNNNRFTGLFTYLDDRFAQFETAIQPNQRWGREPHSPLETWQWILIAIIIGVAIAAVIVCLIWFGCSWILAVFAGVCWGIDISTGGVITELCIAIGF